MLISIRWVLRLFKREQAALSRYERFRYQFFWSLVLDAVLSVALVVGGYQLLFTNSSKAETHEPLEISAISSKALIDKARNENLDAFWLGSVTGENYRINDQESGIVDILYLPTTSGNSNDKTYLYEVKTYKRKEVWNIHTHPILASANTTTVVLNKNVSIKINESSMKGVIATFANMPEIVAIAYPKPQTLDSMEKNVESLKLVR